MTLWIMPEFDREGGQSVSSGSKVANHNETPTDKTESFMALESPRGSSSHHPTLVRGQQGSPKVANSVK